VKKYREIFASYLTDKAFIMSIPKILHQIWIGPKPAPTRLMDTWLNKHPDFEYIRWSEKEIAKRGIMFECQEQIDAMQEINGKADIIRWELLLRYGGYFVDADSICIEPFDKYFEGKTGFATFENENNRKGLVATGTMGFVPNHPMLRAIVNWMKFDREAQQLIRTTRAWYSVGPGLLTRMLETGLYKDFAVYPSHCFLPIHFTGLEYRGHKKVYGYQEWGTAKQSYDTMNSVVLPERLSRPILKKWVSVLITSYNTSPQCITECLNSIKNQTGYFGMEIVWVEDGSDDEFAEFSKSALDKFIFETRFTELKFLRKHENRGAPYAINQGLDMCSYDLIVKMDSDDIMMPDRIEKQIDFMEKHPECQIVGTGAQFFENVGNNRVQKGTAVHPVIITKDEFLRSKPHWFMNHPSVCYRKSAIYSIGKYTDDDPRLKVIHDYEMYLRMLNKYGAVYNIPEVLMMLRLRPRQLTQGLDNNAQDQVLLREELVKKCLFDIEFVPIRTHTL